MEPFLCPVSSPGHDSHTLLGFPIALKKKYLLGYVVNLRDVDDVSSFFADYDQSYCTIHDRSD